MANLRLIKRRIKSAKNISQITYAMQMVAASKMKKAQLAAISARPYREQLAWAVESFAKPEMASLHPLLSQNPSPNKLIVLVTTDKGLCGGLNTNLFRFLTTQFSEAELKSAQYLTIGKKGENFIARSSRNLQASFPLITDAPAINTLIVNKYLTQEVGSVYILFNEFINSLTQKPKMYKLLPISLGKRENKPAESDYLIEPSPDQLVNDLLQAYLENQVKSALNESLASQYSAQMITMKSATDNAKDLISGLTLEYNKARQEKITSEISDIVTARIAAN